MRHREETVTPDTVEQAEVLRSRTDRFCVIALLSTTFPTVLGVSSSVPTPAGTLYLGDVLLPLAVLLTFRYVLARPGDWIPLTLGLSIAFATIVGAYRGADFGYLARDARPLIYAVLGSSLGLYLARRPAIWGWAIRTIVVYVALVAMAGIATQWQPILVADDVANVVVQGNQRIELAGPRLQIGTNPLLQFILSGALAAWILGGRRFTKYIGRSDFVVLLLSSALVLFLSYSRNTFLGLGGAMGAATVVLIARRPSMALTFGVSRWVLIAASLLCVGALAAFSGLGRQQIDSFQSRVLNGFSRAGLQDAGIKWRETEAGYAKQAIGDFPVIGAGVGHFYRPEVRGDPFPDSGGRLYAHNYFYWITIKGGAFLALLTALIFVGGIGRALLWSDHPAWNALALGAIGLLACAAVAPWPGQPNGAAFLFAAVAACWLAPRSGPATTLAA